MIEFDVENGMTASRIMLEVQSADKFPLEIKMGNDTAYLQNEHDATIFSLGMLFAIEMKEIENYK